MIKNTLKITLAALITSLVLAMPGYAVVVIWEGDESSDWGTDGNWDVGSAPGPGDNAVVPSGTPDSPSMDAGSYTFQSLEVQADAIVTCEGDTTADPPNGGGVTITTTGNIDIDGTLTAQSQGFGPGLGPGAKSGYGSSHGGQGNGGNSTLLAASVYGDPADPTALGSGVSAWGTSGSGGGAIKLAADGNVTVNGTITVKGEYASYKGTSGGSISISCVDFAGNGTLNAEGGNTAGGGSTAHPTGGGGRIAINYTGNYTFIGDIKLAGGTSSGNPVGDPGTFYYPDSHDDAALSLDGDKFALAPGTYSIGVLTLDNSSELHLQCNGGTATTINTSSIALLNGSSIVCHGDKTIQGSGPPGTPHGSGPTINCTGNVTVNEGCSITAYKRGFPDAEGPGAAGYSAHGGQGYGGSGTTYGDYENPTALGSGTTGWNSYADGGGAITLSVDGILTVDGTINAKGANGTYGAASGGSINITCGTLAGGSSGKITVQGANATRTTSDYSAAGGGRIKIAYTTYTFQGLITAGGGINSNGKTGYPGTLYDTKYLTNIDVVVDEGGIALPVPKDGYTAYDIGNLTIQDYSTLHLRSGGSETHKVITLNSTGNIQVDSTSRIICDCDTSTINETSGGTAANPHGAGPTITCTGNFTNSGAITADSKGFPGKEGPSPGNTYNGAAHGGKGGRYGYANPISGTRYGLPNSPTALGSGGNSSSQDGGGAITIRADTGTLTVNGTISANSDGGGYGAPSGGSINLSCANFAGSGTISAKGGNSSGGNVREGGGGGRIALSLTGSSTFTGVITAKGGTALNGDGEPGTFYYSDSFDDNGLIVDGGGFALVPDHDLSTAGTIDPYTPGSITIRNNSVLSLQSYGGYAPAVNGTSSLSLESGSTILFMGDTTIINEASGGTAGDPHGGAGSITCTGDITLNGDVTTQQLGFSSQQGPGKCVGAYSGGSYGGLGGRSSGITYGVETNPTALGSGGFHSTARAGGALTLSSGGTLTINGSINANGRGSTGSSGSGGSGGSINLTGSTITGTGSIASNGGIGNTSYGGGGGGGRILLCYDSLTDTNLTATASGGSAANPGQDGTIYCSADSAAFITDPQTILTSIASGPITIRATPQTDLATNEYGEVKSDVTMNLNTTSGTGEFSLNPDTWVSITQVTIEEGTSEVTFYYKDTTVGDYTMTAAPTNGWSAAQQIITVIESLLSDYDWVRKIIITNNTDEELTNFPVRITLDTRPMISEGKMQSDGDDIRVTDSDGRVLIYHWLEDGNYNRGVAAPLKTINNEETDIWTKVDSIPASGTKVVFLWYGNATAESTSDGPHTFTFFDDFSSDTTGSYTWTRIDNGAPVNEHTWDSDDQWVHILTGDNDSENAQRTLSIPSRGYSQINFTKIKDYPADNNQNFNFYQDVANYYRFNVCGHSYTAQGVYKYYLGGSYHYTQTGTVNTNDTEYRVGMWWSATNLRLDINGDTRKDINTTNTTEFVPTYFKVSNSQIDLDWEFMIIHKTTSTDPTTEIGDEWGAVKKLAFSEGYEQTIVENQVSEIITVEAQDKNSDTTYVLAETTIALETTSGTGHFYSDPAGTNEIYSVTIEAEESSTSFYYKDSTGGVYTLTASENPGQHWTDAECNITVISAANSFSVVPNAYTQIAGKEFTLTITALNEDGGIADTFNGTVNLTISPGSARGTLSITQVVLVNGIAVITNQAYSDCGTISIIATQSDDETKTGQSNGIIFVPYDFTVAASSLDASALGDNPGQHTVIKPFTLSITARNAAKATCLDYKGPATLSVDYVSPPTNQSGSLSITSLISANWTDGIAIISDLTYDKWGTVAIKCTDDTLTTQTGSSSEIVFLPEDFTITLSNIPPSRTYYYIGELFDTTVTARDYLDETIINYQGTVSLSGSDLELPEDYTFVADDSGSHIFTATNGTMEGETKITVTDKNYTSVKSVTDTITIKEGTIKVFSNSGPVGPISVKVKLLDSSKEILTEDDSTTFTVTLDEFMKDNDSATSTATTSPVTVTDGVATIVIEDTEPETVTVTPLSDPELISVSGQVRFGTVSGSGLRKDWERELRRRDEYKKHEEE